MYHLTNDYDKTIIGYSFQPENEIKITRSQSDHIKR